MAAKMLSVMVALFAWTFVPHCINGNAAQHQEAVCDDCVDNSNDVEDTDAVTNGHLVQKREIQASKTILIDEVDAYKTLGGSEKSRAVQCPQKNKCLKQNGASCVLKGSCKGKTTKGCTKKCDCCIPETEIGLLENKMNSMEIKIRKFNRIIRKIAICDPECEYGYCKSPNHCICFTGWTGDVCQYPVCDPECTNGVCESPHTCTCNVGWTGDTCQDRVCDPECTNGVCTSPNTCKCNAGWKGDRCQEQITFTSRCNDVNGFLSQPQDECFVYSDVRGDWETARKYCSDLGLVIASPKDGNALWLRFYIIITYGSPSLGPTGRHSMWLDGQGDGSAIVMMNGEVIHETNTLWYPRQPGSSVTTSDCLYMKTHTSSMDRYPYQPYSSSRCSSTTYTTLCELV